MTSGEFGMKRKLIQIILVIAVSLSAPVSSDYFSFCADAASDLLSPNPNDVEDFDQEDLSDASQSESRVLESVGFFFGFEPPACLFGLSSYFSSQKSSLDQKTVILRC